MALHNLTAIRVREPGFSPSECLELARKLERGGFVEQCECGEFESGELDLIIAALRAYAADV